MKKIPPKVYSKILDQTLDVNKINYKKKHIIVNKKQNQKLHLKFEDCILLPALNIQDENNNELYLNDIIRIEYEIDNELRESFHLIQFNKSIGFFIDYDLNKKQPLVYRWADNVYEYSGTTNWYRVINYNDDIEKAENLLTQDNLIKKL